jgi:Flp pilus assembly protein TadD
MSDADDHFERGKREFLVGWMQEAVSYLERASRLEPGNPAFRELLGVAYFRSMRWTEAENEFRAVLDVSPENDFAHYALARSLEQQGRDTEANKHYELAKSLRPDSPRHSTRNRYRELDETQSPP